MNKNINEIANKLKIGLSTLYQWKKTRPELYEYLMKNSTIQKNEITELFEMLEKEEQEMYITEMRARILRKKLR